MLIDPCGRIISYLRLSVTDRCNFRCVYCLPAAFNEFAPSKDTLTDDEIIRLLSIFTSLGVSRIRLTGGEPLLRANIVDLVGRIRKLPGLKDLSLSTNGFPLKKMARDLKDRGLDRVNISLDSLQPERFRSITRFGSFSDVWEGINACQKAGLSPIKINMVVMKGVNDDEISDFVSLTEKSSLHVRFIELMPMGEIRMSGENKWLPYEDILRRAGPLEDVLPREKPVGFGPARVFRRPGARGTVGVIGALGCGFCSTCNRVRLTSTGTLVPCLDGNQGTELRPALRGEAAVGDIAALIEKTIGKKPEGHTMLARMAEGTPNIRFMAGVGG